MEGQLLPDTLAEAIGKKHGTTAAAVLAIIGEYLDIAREGGLTLQRTDPKTWTTEETEENLPPGFFDEDATTTP